MELMACYKMLDIPPSSSDEEVTRAYKQLAHRYHPDKNRDRIEWATRAMSNLNIAYTTITSHRFSSATKSDTPGPAPGGTESRRETREGPRSARPQKKKERAEGLPEEILIKQFVNLRERAKDALYKYFQYGLYNMIRRENVLNRGVFNEVVLQLRKSYHGIRRLSVLTGDAEILDHFNAFNSMIFSFYRSSECLNIPDSYSNLMDVEAFRIFKKGDEALHVAHKELFYDRHNRGYFRRDITDPLLLKAEYHFREGLKSYPESTWATETAIKLEYVIYLKKYILLFFTGESDA